MRKLFSNKLFLLLLVTLLLGALIIFSTIPGNPVHSLSRPFSYILSPVQRGIRSVGGRISDFYVAVTEGMELRHENEALREEIARLEYEVAQGEEARRRWEELREAFHIRDSFENYTIIGTSILSREADEWFSLIRIDLGEADGLELSDETTYAVVDARMNLVGRVLTAETGSAKVLPLLHEGFTVSAKVNTVNGAVVMVTGETVLQQEGLCRVVMIPSGIELQPGDELVTSGKGGLFPPGIPIGIIESVDYSSELDRYATLRPYVNISEIKDVFVMIPELMDDGWDIEIVENGNDDT